MLVTLLKSKLHMARVTESVPEYEGSLTVDPDLMDKVKLVNYEKILVSNMENGNRFETYVIPGKRGSGVIGLNGPTTHLGKVGDRLVVISFIAVPQDKVRVHHPIVMILDAKNKPLGDVKVL